MSKEMKPITISAAEHLAKSFGYHQVVIVARRVGEGGGEHMTTYGTDAANCSVAAMIGARLQRELMGWTHDGSAQHVAQEALQERLRQVAKEGFTAAHDDDHDDGQMAAAAACYLLYSDAYPNAGQPPEQWPWEAAWWKPKEYRRDLIRALALVIAEVERLDRAHKKDAGCVL